MRFLGWSLGPWSRGKNLEGWVRQLRSAFAIRRRHAAEALGEFGPAAAAATPALLRLLSDEDWTVRDAAVWALRAVCPDGLEPGAISGEAFRDLALEARLVAAELVWRRDRRLAPFWPTLLEALESPDRNGRMQAHIALLDMGPDADAAVPLLLCTLQETDHLDSGVVLVLGALGAQAKAAVPYLIERLAADHNTSLIPFTLARLAAAALPVLVAALADERPPVRAGVAAALAFACRPDDARFTPEAIFPALPALRRALNDPNAVVRLRAARAVGHLCGDEAMVDHFRAGLRDADPSERREALEGLYDAGPAARGESDAVRQALRDPDRSVRAEAARALWRIAGDARSVLPVLLAALKESVRADDSAVCPALFALRTMGADARPALPALRKLATRAKREYERDALRETAERIDAGPPPPTT